jgi:hypothetical protein
MSRHSVRLAVVLAVVLALLVVVPAIAKNGPPSPPDETATNNLSVPTIMIGGGFTGVTVPQEGVIYPTGTPLAGYEVAGDYYVQGVHKWQAETVAATSATGTAEWGDNLSGDAKLKVGSPIRVELGLFDDTGLQMQGFNVIKLEPSQLDRESAYGTLASTDDGGTTWYATAEYLPVRIFDAGVTFSVSGPTGYVVDPGSNPTAEINATGKVVYGYNLRVPAAGAYTITFVIPNVDITGVDAGTFVSDPEGADTVTLVINVVGGGGGGGGGKPR